MNSPQRACTLDREMLIRAHANFLLYLPDHCEGNRDKIWPCILFLHGAGERGEDLGLVKRHGLPRLIEEGHRFPFVVVSPQCPQDTWWRMEVLDVLLQDILARHPVDPARVYVTGLSMGGYGTWALALQYPGRFAAIAPVCGGGNPLRAHEIAHIPAWVFHGAKDDVVPLRESEKMVDSLNACGGNVRFTVYPDAAHDSWTEAYNNPELYEWLLQHRRSDSRTRT
ncbi:MAG: phospholipase [Armatimonadetes bacterium CG2_30_59_28]|nr:MAG: phospholipase [Armatimonadetes bacterium CG2_30_59_28]